MMKALMMITIVILVVMTDEYEDGFKNLFDSEEDSGVEYHFDGDEVWVSSGESVEILE